MSRELAVFLDDLRAELSVYPIGSRISKRLHDRLMYLDDKYRGTVDPGRMPADACKDCGSTGAHYCTGKPINGFGNQQIQAGYKEWVGTKYDASGGPPTPEQFQETVDRMKNETGKDRRFEREYLGRWEGPEMFERVRRD